MNGGFKFPKQQRLTHKKQIEALFANGASAVAYPLRIKYLENGLPYHRVLIAVPKRNLPLATQRNKVKRWIREAFRLHQHELSQLTSHQDMVITYTQRKLTSFLEIEKGVLKLGKLL